MYRHTHACIPVYTYMYIHICTYIPTYMHVCKKKNGCLGGYLLMNTHVDQSMPHILLFHAYQSTWKVWQNLDMWYWLNHIGVYEEVFPSSLGHLLFSHYTRTRLIAIVSIIRKFLMYKSKVSFLPHNFAIRTVLVILHVEVRVSITNFLLVQRRKRFGYGKIVKISIGQCILSYSISMRFTRSLICWGVRMW